MNCFIREKRKFKSVKIVRVFKNLTVSNLKLSGLLNFADLL